jgi:RNA polymerase sigma-70 factor (ECF subfamily)
VDRALVERARDGDGEAYELLVRHLAGPLFEVAQRILRDIDAAEDAVQRALVAIWRELPRLRDLDRFDQWVYRLTVRASLDEARRARRHAHVRDIDVAEPSAPDASLSLATSDALERAFRRLSPEHRAVVVLHHYAGFPLTEIALILGVPYGTVGSRLHYAVRALREAMRADDVRARRDARRADDADPVPNGRLA